jgi:hypothetical protein
LLAQNRGTSPIFVPIFALNGQIRQKRLHLNRSHFGRVTFLMKKNKMSRPLDILMLGPYAVMLESQALQHLIGQFWRRGGIGVHDKI